MAREATRVKLISSYLLAEIVRIKADEEIKAFQQTSRCTADGGWQYCVVNPSNACEHCRKIQPLYQKRKTARLIMITKRKMLSRNLRINIKNGNMETEGRGAHFPKPEGV